MLLCQLNVTDIAEALNIGSGDRMEYICWYDWV